jgi:tetratricopeptide (TPR) repeat protein
LFGITSLLLILEPVSGTFYINLCFIFRMKLFFNILLTIFVILNSYPQQRNLEQKLRVAQYFEQIQDWENAVNLYEELFKVDSVNVVFFNALLRGYDQLKRYDNAVTIINTQLKFRQNDVALLSQLGKMYARGGDNEKAIASWERALETDKKNINSYTVVASTMIESRMLEQAIKVYQRGRSVLENPYLFAPDLGYLNSMFMNFTEATREYLLLLEQSPAQLGFVQSRISAYTSKADGLSAAILVVSDAQKSEPNNLALLQLLAWLYMEGKEYDQAFSIYKSIDEKLKAGGHEIYNFGERALREKAYSSAAKAFGEVIKKYPKSLNVGSAKFGYARTLEEASADEDTSKLFGDLKPFQFIRTQKQSSLTNFRPSYSAAIEAYTKLILEYPKTEFAANSLYRTAYIHFNVFFDPVKSLDALHQIEKTYSNLVSILIESSALMGKVYVAQGNLDKASDKFQWLNDSRSTSTDTRERANFGLAEIEFFKGNYKDAISRLQSLTKNPASETTNDALALLIFIQENQQDENVLKKYSAALLLKKQRQFELAVEVFQTIVKENPTSEIVEEILINIGDIYSITNRFNDAIAVYEKLKNDFPESIMSDKSQMKIAAVYQLGLKENDKAMAGYQKLLEQFPNSIYVSEARRRIRELRGDAL